MPARRGRVIRPLLFLSASQIRDYCHWAGINYRQDESNLSLDYVRNRIRQTVIPRLEEIRPDFRDRILDTLALLEDEDAVLEAVTAEAWRDVVVEEGVQTYLLASNLAELPRATARLLVRRWLSGASGRRVRLSRRLLDRILDLCQNTSGSRSLSLAKGLRVERKYDKLYLIETGSSTQGTGTETPLEPVTLPIPGKAVFGDFEIEAVETPWWGVFSVDPTMVTVDATYLKTPLMVRSWRPGDKFTPLGLKGSKSVQDLFTDAKVPRHERLQVPIVTSGEKIVWVCGLRIAEDFKVTPESKRLVGLKATRSRAKGNQEDY
jgi:tRNA(Ile)-lysidine synthase